MDRAALPYPSVTVPKVPTVPLVLVPKVLGCLVCRR
jgi:hypothetical protein